MSALNPTFCIALPGHFPPFADVHQRRGNPQRQDRADEAVQDAITAITAAFAVQEQKQPQTQKSKKSCADGFLLAGAMSHALCLLNKVLVGSLPHIEPRVLCLNASADVTSAYIPLKNCIFSAQKRSVCIDACVLTPQDSLLLQ